MPELPEVETIRRELRGDPARAIRDGDSHATGTREPILDRRILGAQLLWERTLAEPAPGEFRDRISGQIIREIDRRGKFLILRLDRDALLFHLRMSGDLLVEPADAPLAPHHRLVLDLEGDQRLAFNDPRKFGRAWLVTDPREVLVDLGPEPLNAGFTPDEFHSRLLAHRRQLKPLLLDQAFLAGLGNIYTDEALHLARLHPLALSSSLDYERAESLWAAIRQVLEEAIARQGASIDRAYRGGDFQNYFRVYSRTGEPCSNCGTPIARIVVGQRGTHFCPHCQKLPEDQGRQNLKA